MGGNGHEKASGVEKKKKKMIANEKIKRTSLTLACHPDSGGFRPPVCKLVQTFGWRPARERVVSWPQTGWPEARTVAE